MTDTIQDKWARWLLHRRHGDSAKQMQVVNDFLYPIRDRVLSHAKLGEGETLLDVGSGDGLLSFGALEKVKTSKVIFVEISHDLLHHTEALAHELDVAQRCKFILASAEDLSALAPASVDAVTTRSVLIYVSSKQRALKEFYHVLKPGGRISLFEPINRFNWPPPAHTFQGYDITPIMDIAAKVRAVYRQAQPPENDPMLDFDERDMLLFVERAGFKEIQMELQVHIGPPPTQIDWEMMLKSSPNPKVPTLQEALREALTPIEAETFEQHLRPLVDEGKSIQRLALMYLWATK